MKFEKRILGKEFYTYDPNINCTHDDLRSLLKKYSRLEILRTIANFSAQIFNNNNILNFSSIPLTNDILLTAAEYTIKYANLSENKIIPENDLKLFFRMCHKFSNSKIVEKTQNHEEILINYSYKQFIFQENLLSQFARSHYIYTNLWERVECENKIDILKEIESILGLRYEIALFFTYASVGNKDGYLFEYDKKTIDGLNKATSLQINISDHQKYLKWASETYSYFDKYDGLMSPFVFYPIINTQTKPPGVNSEVYIIVNHHLLYDKITNNLYFQLAEKFDLGNGKNQFKVNFGYVFQEYIGEILKFHFHNWTVHSEINYLKAKKEKNDTVDWLITKENKMILIEVKQSSIFLESKINCKISDIKKDLEKTLAKGVRQLKKTKTDILSKKYKELSKFEHINQFQYVIVTNDRFYYSNYIGKNSIKEIIPDIDFDFHIISVNELEILLSEQKESESFFDLLTYKSLEFPLIDFKEFLFSIFPNGNNHPKFLSEYYSNFFNKISLNIQLIDK